MAQAPGGCDFCGKSISSSDFDKGRAVILLKKTYCRSCMESAIERSKTRRRQARSPSDAPAPGAGSAPRVC